jgi:hypothetical protein
VSWPQLAISEHLVEIASKFRELKSFHTRTDLGSVFLGGVVSVTSNHLELVVSLPQHSGRAGNSELFQPPPRA